MSFKQEVNFDNQRRLSKAALVFKPLFLIFFENLRVDSVFLYLPIPELFYPQVILSLKNQLPKVYISQNCFQ